MSIRRPGREDTDDDLLRLQEEFLAKKETPSVNIKNNVLRSSKLPSDVKFDFESLKNSATSDTTRNFPHDKIPVPEEMLNILSTNSNTALNQSSNISSGIQSQHKNSGPPKRKSLFALRMEKSRADAKTASTVIEDKSTASGSQFGDHSYIISGKEANEIHQQNVAQLESLSVSEIEQERKRLMSQLSSSTVKFLQSRRKNVVLSNEKLKVTHENVNLEHPAKENICEDKVPVQHVQKNKVFSSSFSSMQLNDEVKGTNEDLLDTLPINPNEAKEWLHMDVIEKEKLEWMKSLPPVKSKPAPDEAYSARFDFQGVLLPFNDEELDVNKGLHHHGDEPERPGYTLQELIQLSRSSVLQQRTMGLNTIGNILLKTKLGIYDKVLQQSIIKELLDVGVFLLFRFSMDDTSPSVVIAALTAMRNLLYNEPDEAGLDFLLGCEGGLQNPVLDIPVEEGDAKKIQEQKDYEAELKDFEIIQLDVLKGAERTNLILRLGYILDVIKGPPDVVLDLLVRIARHSRQLGEGVASCGGLLRTIRDQLLTTQVIPSLVAGVGQPGYGEPSSKALRLIRVLAAQSRTIANTLIEKFNIMEPIMTYVSMSSPELPHIQSLVVHGFYLWQTFLCYGLTSECILDLFPILMRQLHYHVQVTSATGEGSSASGHELATALAGVIEKGCEITSSDIKVLDAKPVFQLANLIVDCLHKWFSQLNSDFSEVPSWSCVKMIGSALNCLTSILFCAKNQDTIDSKSIQKRLETLAHDSIFPFLKSVCLQKLLENLMSSSFFLGNGENGTRRDPPNLPSLGAIEWGGENLVPGLLLKSPYPLISGLMRFLGAYCTVFSTSSKKELQTILLDNKHLDEYIQAFVTRPLRSSNHWFCRQEVYMLHHLLVLVVLQPSLVPDNKKPKFTHLALRILDLIQANDKYLISRLLPITIFNTEFVRWGMSQHSEREKSVNSAVEECLDGLSSIGSLYLSMLGLRFLKVLPPSLRTSLTSLSRGTEPALPIDWLFAPLLVFYGQYNAQNRARYLEADTISMVTETLQFLFLMETLWPISRRPLSVTARWCRLALVFLAGSDLFLDDDVRKYLRMNLNNLLLQRHKLNFSESIPGLSSFYDLYGELLLQFSAISYGDKLFGAFILLPLQQKQDPQLRRMIWGENAVVLRVLSTSVDEVGVPLDEFLTPTETDASLLTSYLEAIAKGHIIEERCPLIFKIAVHHVATFIQEQGGHPLAVSLKRSIDCIANKAIQELFLNYHSPTAL